MDLANKIHVVTEAGLPLMIYGDPGIGKTYVVYDYGRHFNLPTKCIIASLYESESFIGVPYVSNEQVKYSDPELFVDFKNKNKGILFFDEINTCSKRIQNILLRIILEKVAGNLKLHPNIKVIAAGNYTNVEGNIQMNLALANRFVNIFEKENPELWSAGIVSGFKAPTFIRIAKDWREKWLPHYSSLISEYIRCNPTSLKVMPTEFEDITKMAAWPSPRTWEYAIKILAITHDMDIKMSERKELLTSTVGPAFVHEVFQFIKERDLHSIDKIDPSNIVIPKNPDNARLFLKMLVFHSDNPKYSDLCIKAFKVAFDSGYQPLVMDNAKAVAKQLSTHMSSNNILKSLTFLRDVIRYIS